MKTGLNDKETTALKNLLFRMADDELIIGHRNSEWTGLGPALEEDIAFSSMAQDKLGHAQAFYNILNELGEKDADRLAFGRKANEFCNSQLTEYPNGDYAFSLMRHYLFDTAEYLRFENLRESSYKNLSDAVKKFYGEVKYHVMHADIWIKQLGKGNEDSNSRMQKALDVCMPLALGIFEPSEFEDILISASLFEGEKTLQKKWFERISDEIKSANLNIPDVSSVKPAYGGRNGIHTEHLQPLLDEMTEVYNIDPGAEW